MYRLEKNDIAPFLSILLAVKTEKTQLKDIHIGITEVIKQFHISSSEINVLSSSGEDDVRPGEPLVHFTHYEIQKKPSWMIGSDINDIENHILVLICLGNTLAIYTSEKGMKDEIRSSFKNKLTSLKVIDIKSLNYLFINEDKVKMLWLLGIHGKNSSKADSKVLGGDSVADTLDPLEDQSFTMSAVRTELDDKGRTTGINPYKSSLWRGPCKNWLTFENRVVEILDKIEKNDGDLENPISILATAISNFTEVKDLYDLSFVDYDFYKDDASTAKYDLLQSIHHEYTYEVVKAFNEKNIELKVFHKFQPIGVLCADVSLKEYDVEFEVKISATNNKKKELQYFSKAFRYPELIKCWYQSGHAIVNGKIYKTDYRDVIYDKHIWADFEDYSICIEKPEDNARKVVLDQIGNKKSLFCWVKNRWCGSWSNKSDFTTTEKPNGWLYCDDGAGEKADFIHVSKQSNFYYIDLIHIKAAGSESLKRNISVGVHDIVLNQAVKNLRYTNRKNLIDALNARVSNSNMKFCWEDGSQANPLNFINHLENIKAELVKVRVVVIQPHTRKNSYSKTTSSNIKKQLDVLLVSADSAIRASGAEFFIIGFHDKDTQKSRSL